MKRTLAIGASRLLTAGILAGALATGSFAIHAERHRAWSAPLLAEYHQECGSCHVAFPPSLLPSRSWQRLMGDLPHHFGVDASLDPSTTKAVAEWLAQEGGNARGADPLPHENRITRSPWFVRKHREVAPSAWQRPAVKQASNCAACHAGAERGEFNEHDVRIPR